jgi:hypothetical protein
MIAFAAGVVLVAARIRLGRGAAIAAALFQSIAFGVSSLAIHTGFGLTTLHFPLYIAEAAIVELVALAPLADPRRHRFSFGLWSGLLIGTVGVAAEWAWSHVWMPLPWTASMLGQTAALAPAAALAGGVIGAYCGTALDARDREATTSGLGTLRLVGGPRWALPLAGAAIVFCIAYPLPMNAGPASTATASLTQTTRDGKPAVEGTFTFSPRNTADNAQWVHVIDWQGGGLVVDHLRRIAEGVYQTTQPIPVGGKWKAMVRIENGRSLRAVPVYLPNDPAIPAKGVPAAAHSTRPFVYEKAILQREAVGGPPGLATAAYLLLMAIVSGWLAAVVAGMRRMGGGGGGTAGRRGRLGAHARAPLGGVS